MRITFNGDSAETADDTAADTAASLIERLHGQLLHGEAVAVNDEVVPRARLADRPLAEGDRIEVVQAVAGG